MKELTISDLISTNYKDFSKYVCYNRSIPHLIDGFKPSQRKAFFCNMNRGSFIKVMALAGEMIAKANYHHGDASASETISKMGQDFTGSNNIPPFLKDGSFGNVLSPDPSAPRYIYVKKNPLYYSIFKDMEICNKGIDPEDPEPEFYLPIIPTVLLNGIKGIAVGFASKIQPYNIKEIIFMVREFLYDRYCGDWLTPYYHGYKGDITFDTEKQKWVMYGVFEQINTTTIHISEVPVSFDRNKYVAHLYKLMDENLITSFSDSGKRNWDITIRLPRKSKVWDDPITNLKLSENLNENLTVINQDGKIFCFDSVIEIIDEFVKYRLTMYDKRRKYMIGKLKALIALSNSKIQFIRMMNSINFKKMTRDEIKDYALKKGCKPNHLKKHMEIKAHNLNQTHIEETYAKIKEYTELLQWYMKITALELYEIDLTELEGSIK